MPLVLFYAKGTAASAAKELGINESMLVSGQGIPGSILVLMCWIWVAITFPARKTGI